MNQDPPSSGILRLHQIPLKQRHAIPGFERRSSKGMEYCSRLELANRCLILGKNPLPRPLKKPLGGEAYRGLAFDRLDFRTPKQFFHKGHNSGNSLTPKKSFNPKDQGGNKTIPTLPEVSWLLFRGQDTCSSWQPDRIMDKLIFRFADSRRHVKSGSLFFVHGQKA